MSFYPGLFIGSCYGLAKKPMNIPGYCISYVTDP